MVDHYLSLLHDAYQRNDMDEWSRWRHCVELEIEFLEAWKKRCRRWMYRLDTWDKLTAGHLQAWFFDVLYNGRPDKSMPMAYEDKLNMNSFKAWGQRDYQFFVVLNQKQYDDLQKLYIG